MNLTTGVAAICGTRYWKLKKNPVKMEPKISKVVLLCLMVYKGGAWCSRLRRSNGCLVLSIACQIIDVVLNEVHLPR